MKFETKDNYYPTKKPYLFLHREYLANFKTQITAISLRCGKYRWTVYFNDFLTIVRNGKSTMCDNIYHTKFGHMATKTGIRINK